MGTSWADLYARCPFYLSCNGKDTINCQGVADSSTLAWKFRKKEDLVIQTKTFCAGHFEFCEVYRMLKEAHDGEF